MAEVLVQFTEPVIGEGVAFMARACGARGTDGLWQGWIEFSPLDGDPTLRSPRETSQPNRDDTMYWATGLSAVYLEGALRRTLSANRSEAPMLPSAMPIYRAPAPAAGSRPRSADDGSRKWLGDGSQATVPAGAGDLGRPADAVLDPFAVYRKGEQLLRQQLGALSAWHLVTIVEAYGLSRLDLVQLNAMREPALIELIVLAVGRRRGRPEATRRAQSAGRQRTPTRAASSARR